MSTPFEVLVDRDDDITVVRALHRLAFRERGLCVAAVPPDSHISVAVRWAILRALGKRSQRLRGMPHWHDVARWLTAHCVTELVLLRAQHLSEPVLEEIAEELAGRLGVRVVLVYSGTSRASASTYRSIDLVTLATRARPSMRPRRRARAWPAAPRVHPLRLRHDARAMLGEREFQDVQRLLAAACSTMSTWLLHHAGATSSQIATAYEIVSTGLDDDHAFIRRSGAEIALLAAGVRVERRNRLPAHSCHLSESGLATLHQFTEPAAAALQLAKQLTGIPNDLLGLIAGDQIGEDRILGYRVPDAALPILRALDRRYGPVCDDRSDPVQRTRLVAQGPSAAKTDGDAATTVAWLLESGRHAVRDVDLDDSTRTELTELGRRGLFTFHESAFRASDVALYGAFQRAAPTPRDY